MRDNRPTVKQHKQNSNELFKVAKQEAVKNEQVHVNKYPIKLCDLWKRPVNISILNRGYTKAKAQILKELY